MRSWRTTILGVCGLVSIASQFIVANLDNDPSTQYPLQDHIPEIIICIGLIKAKDAQVGGQGGPVKP